MKIFEAELNAIVKPVLEDDFDDFELSQHGKELDADD